MQTTSERSSLGFAFVITWVLVNTLSVGLLSLLIGLVLFISAYGGQVIPASRIVDIGLFGLFAGLLCGGAQALVLRRVVPSRSRWIFLTAIGSAAGLTVSLFLNDIITAGLTITTLLADAAVFGTVVGVCQWVELRQLRWAAGWVFASAIGSVLGLSTIVVAGLPYAIVTVCALFAMQKYSSTEGRAPSFFLSLCALVTTVVMLAVAIGLGLTVERQAVRVLNGHDEELSHVAFLSGGKTLASMDIGTINLWDSSSGKLLRTMHGGSYQALAASPDGLQMAAYHADIGVSGSSVTIDRKLVIWNVSDGQVVRTLPGFTIAVACLAFAPDGQSLAIGVGNGNLEIVGLNDERDRIIGTESGGANSIAFSPDGTLLASAGEDGVSIWDLVRGLQQRTLRGHTQGVGTIAVSPDGRFIATGSWDHTAKIWDIRTGLVIHTLVGHSGDVNAVTFSPDSRTLVTGSSDDTIVSWDVISGQRLKTFVGHAGPVRSLAFSPDGRTLASGASDFTVRLWSLGN